MLNHWLSADFVPDADVIAAVNRWTAQGIPLVLATNQEHERARFLTTELGGLLPIAGIAYSAALGVTKDNPAFFSRARRHLGISDTAVVVFVDDDPTNVRTAETAGWLAVRRSPGDDSWRHDVEVLLTGHRTERK